MTRAMKIHRLQTMDPPDMKNIERLLPAETEQAQPGLYVAHTLPMLVVSSANENVASDSGTVPPRRALWPR